MCFSRFLREITYSHLQYIYKVLVCHKTLLCEPLNYKHADPGFYVWGVYVDGFCTKRVRRRLNVPLLYVKYTAFQSK